VLLLRVWKRDVAVEARVSGRAAVNLEAWKRLGWGFMQRGGPRARGRDRRSSGAGVGEGSCLKWPSLAAVLQEQGFHRAVSSCAAASQGSHNLWLSPTRARPGLCVKMRKNFFPLKVTEPWPRLPREVVESPSLEIFKTSPGQGPVQPALGHPASLGAWTR